MLSKAQPCWCGVTYVKRYILIVISFFCILDPFKPFIIFSNRHEIRRIDLNKGDYSVLVPGLRNTIALDFHLNQSTLYWTDVVEDKIYRGKLSESGGKCYIVYLYHNAVNSILYTKLSICYMEKYRGVFH